MIPTLKRHHQNLVLVFAIGLIGGAILLAAAIPPDAWEVAWRFRGPAA